MATLFYMMKCGERRGEKGWKNQHQTTKKCQKSKGKIMENLEPKKEKRNYMERGKEK